MTGSLQAPCGSEFLHQIAVRVYWRAEDDDGCIVETSNGDARRGPFQLIVHDAKSTEFSGRRQSVQIDFSCEHCRLTHTLLLDQNKGNTDVEWLS